jgi:hypothetical protein
MKLHNINNLLDFVFQTMEDASEEELRLSIYFLSIFLFTDQKHCWIYLDEVENGRDIILDSLKREKFLKGIGLNREQIINAIDQVNKRGVITIHTENNSNYLLKVQLNNFYQNKNYEGRF